MDNIRIQRTTDVIAPTSIDHSPKAKLDKEGKNEPPVRFGNNKDRSQKAEELSKLSTEEFVKIANDRISKFTTKITFAYDATSNRKVIFVTEKDTGRVIRQIPPEQMVNLMDKMEEIAGIIYNGRA